MPRQGRCLRPSRRHPTRRGAFASAVTAVDFGIISLPRVRGVGVGICPPSSLDPSSPGFSNQTFLGNDACKWLNLQLKRGCRVLPPSRRGKVILLSRQTLPVLRCLEQELPERRGSVQGYTRALGTAGDACSKQRHFWGLMIDVAGLNVVQQAHRSTFPPWSQLVYHPLRLVVPAPVPLPQRGRRLTTTANAATTATATATAPAPAAAAAAAAPAPAAAAATATATATTTNCHYHYHDHYHLPPPLPQTTNTTSTSAASSSSRVVVVGAGLVGDTSVFFV